MLREPQGRVRRKRVKAKRRKRTPRKQGLLNTAWPTQRVQQNAQDLHMSVPDDVLDLKWKVNTSPIFKTEAIFTHENYFSLMESCWRSKLLLSVGPMPSSRWTTENELKSIFGASLSHNVCQTILFIIFTLQVLCLYIVSSDIVFVGFLIY